VTNASFTRKLIFSNYEISEHSVCIYQVLQCMAVDTAWSCGSDKSTGLGCSIFMVTFGMSVPAGNVDTDRPKSAVSLILVDVC
jgi:hypothetical protein